MRNLVEYPITPKEVHDLLDKLADQPTNGIGNMNPLLLRTAATVISIADLICKNTGTSTARTLLIQAFNSQNPSESAADE